ncbi:MAG: hypothetical protein Q8R55_03445 [Candidatus Taylorbacteria bacterium]|nr:hypothetical protein [Candidatus Taylorbacteria bacterium]
MLPKFLEFIKARQSEVVLGLAVVLIAVIAFESGRISVIGRHDEPLEIKHVTANITDTESANQKLDLRVVASKNSTLYHFLWCSGAKRIKEENKIIFSNEQEAQNRGHKLASNCDK